MTTKIFGVEFVVNTMSYSKEFKMRCIKQVKMNLHSVGVTAELKKVSFKSLYRWLGLFERYGESGLDNEKPGAKETTINPKFEKMILDEWKKRKRSSHKLWITMKTKGFDVSERQIQKIFKKHGLKMSLRKRPSQIKFVKYEWPRPNMLWHTDWTTCPFTEKQLIAFIDDYSRFIIHAQYFDNASTGNTLIAFEKAIKKYGIPDAILTDNGVQFHVHGDFEKFCRDNNIKHILGRVHHPQTNGKIERWFGTYKLEFKDGEDTLKKFVNYYNEERLHQGIHYQVPLERYKIVINAV